MAALAVGLVADDVAWAQITNANSNTNRIQIIPRKHRYSSRIQLLNQPTPAPLPPDQEPAEDNTEKKLQDTANLSRLTPLPQGPMRRPLPKKEIGQKSPQLQPFDASTNEVMESKSWGWLAGEAEESRKYLRESQAAREQTGDTNATPATANAKGTNQVERGALTEYGYKPVLGSTTQTTAVERVVEDKAVRLAEQQHEEEARQAAAKKESLNVAEQQNVSPMLTETNETLGLMRSHREGESSAIGQDFQQTRMLMSEINERYQLNFGLEDAARRATGAQSPKPERTRAAAGNEKLRSTDGRRPANYSDLDQGSALSRTPAADAAPAMNLPDTSSRVQPAMAERGRMVMPASSRIEPPKASQGFGLPGGSSKSFSSTPSARQPATSYPASGFTPAAPYKSTFESSTLSR